jgi:hypothetical protein
VSFYAPHRACMLGRGLLDVSTYCSLSLRCDMSTNPKIFFSRSCCFSPKNKILILFYVVSRFMQKFSIFHGKIARYDVLKIKFLDISHRRYKLRRDIE